MEKLSTKYFKREIYDDPSTGIRITARESGFFSIFEEGYSLKISTRQTTPAFVHRDYHIEHHKQLPHNFPHLQFKFSSEDIGQFRLRIDISNTQEYKKAILGFIYRIKEVIDTLEESRPGITAEIMNVKRVNGLKTQGDFLTRKIREGIQKYHITFDQERPARFQLQRIQQHQLLICFIGRKNITAIATPFLKIKK